MNEFVIPTVMLAAYGTIFYAVVLLIQTLRLSIKALRKYLSQ